MGKKVLRQLALEHDTRQTEYSVLWQEVNDWLGRKDFTLNEWIRGSIYWRELTNDFNQWVQRTQHPHDPRTLIFYFAHRLSSSSDSEGMNEGIETLRRIASGLVTPLVAAKDRGDAVAKEILAAGILDLVEQHRQAVLAAKTLFQEAAIAPLVLYGGVFDHNPQFRLDLADRINSTYQTQLTPITASSPEAMRPVLGALLFALGDSSTGDLVLPDRKTIDSVVTSARSHQFATGLSND
jgi:N-acetylglucosamine kinase-like BadF-type ATPase